MKSANNLGVALYVLAGLASISMSLLLSIAPHTGATLFPQPTPQDVARLIQSVYR